MTDTTLITVTKTVSPPTLKVLKVKDKYIIPLTPLTHSVNTPIKRSNNLNQSEHKEDALNEISPELKIKDYKFVIGHKVLDLKEVRGESVKLEYKISSSILNAELDWNSTLPNIPLLLEITVGKAIIKVELLTSYIEKFNSKFRRASDVRGYNDTCIPTHWSVNDICFFLRTLILNYIVDSHPMGNYLHIFKSIVWKYELLSNERLQLLTEGIYTPSVEDIQKSQLIKQVEEVNVL